jgi:drug/metabolite transporter (DMT)-like permease
LLAALLHASWHGLVKSVGNHVSILAGMGVVSGAIAACFLPFIGPLPATAWLVIAASVPIHVAYKASLASAYRHGGLSEAYPLGRGIVPLFASALGFLGLGEAPTVGQLSAIALICAGIISLSAQSIKRRGAGRLILPASGVGLTVAVYSVLDAYGTRIAGSWLSFTVWLVIFDTAAFLLFAWAARGHLLVRELSAIRWQVLAGGILGVGSFSVFLWAISRSPIGPVTALRETSVLFAACIGMLLLGERRSAGRVLSVVLIAVGTMLLALAPHGS